MNLRNYRQPLYWAFLGLAVCLTGCPLVAWTVAQFAPPQRVDALYKPPEGMSFFVLVQEPPYEPISYPSFKRQLADDISLRLEEEEVAGKAISYNRLIELKSSRPDFWRLSPTQIGQQLGADYVLHVQIKQFSLRDSEASPIWSPRVSLRVSVLNVADGCNAWPTDRFAYGMPTISLPATPSDSPSYRDRAAQDLAGKASDQVAKLFYDHTVDVQSQQEDTDPSMSWGDEPLLR